MNLFERPSANYLIPEDVVVAISKDEASPIKNFGDLLPNGAHVLDIGCGNGVLARVISSMGKAITIDGIEPNPVAAALAKPFYTNVHEGTSDTVNIDFKQYSYIVLADVLEHMVNPQLFFESLIPKLNSDVKIFISIPNISFGAVRISLLNGKFEYVDSGLLEKTHLRFFTRKLAYELFSSVGLRCTQEIHLRQNFWKTEINLSQCHRIPIITDPSADIYQYLFVVDLDRTIAEVSVEKRGFSNSIPYQLKRAVAHKILNNSRR
jgi:2-polyprenyl-3-methyl-5-hydroxy-6-metoxy-1,4-benzoquinol methylase